MSLLLLQDLTQVAAGTFAHRLKKAVDYGSDHVYSCILCSQKGFICELCHHPKVIYPFELTTTTRVSIVPLHFDLECTGFRQVHTTNASSNKIQ